MIRRCRSCDRPFETWKLLVCLACRRVAAAKRLARLDMLEMRRRQQRAAKKVAA